MRGLVGAALVAILTATFSSETAQAADAPSPAPVTVQWTAPPTCPAAAQIDGAIATLLRGSTKTGLLVDARVVVTREASDRFRAEVRTRSEGHQARRTFRAATCQSLADATALLLALMIDPDAAPPAAPVVAPPPPPAPAPLGPPALTSPPPSPPPSSPRLPPRPVTFSPRLQLGAVVDDGTFVGAEAGIEAAVGVNHGPFLLSLGGAYFPAITYNGVGDAGGAEIHFFDVRLLGCVRPLAFAPLGRSFPLWVCLGPALEHLTATLPQLALGFQSLDWASLVAGLAVEPRLGLFGLQLRTELVVPLRRDGLVDDAGNEIFRPSPAAFRGSADLVVHFP